MIVDFNNCQEIEDGHRRFNYNKIYDVFQKEIKDKKRLMAKLRDKNGVLKHQKEQLNKKIKQYLHNKEVN